MDPFFEEEVTLLLEKIFQTYKYDFRDYSRASMKRRLIQAGHELHCESLTMLQAKILAQPVHFFEMLQFLTIPVSEMFRDPTYYQSFRENIVPVLSTYPSLKIWVAGCSTGEEVYSLAIILHEEGLLERTMIYGTDINSRSLEKAEAGIYKLSDMQKFTSNYQKSGGRAEFSDYYTAAFDSVLFNKNLKKNITFTDHSLATDNVFSETHFISCRNVLIYFERKLQQRAIGLFHNSLCRKGFLGLGPKETIEFSKYNYSFDFISKENRLYQKNERELYEDGME